MSDIQLLREKYEALVIEHGKAKAKIEALKALIKERKSAMKEAGNDVKGSG